MNQGLLFLLDNDSVILQQGSLGYYMQENHHPGFNLTDSGWFIIPKWFDPWKTMSHGDNPRVDLNDTVSFIIIFTLRAVSTTDPFLFDILPRLEPPDDRGTAHQPHVRWDVLQNFTDTLNITSQSGKGIRVTATFSSSISTYSVRINYDRSAHNLSVYLVREADVETIAATTQLNATETLTPDALLFAITSSMEQLLELHNWNFTIKVQVTEQSRGPNIATIVSSVLGSAAATATIAAAVYFYLNSKYRRWKKDLDKLTKTMQSLPGVPMQVDFADIKKATNSFHETMRLGQGGFGAVYRCRLPAPNKGKLMDVAIKKFTRADNQGYEDFLAEVSIINRLRHKNIVPLVGKLAFIVLYILLCDKLIICSTFLVMTEKRYYLCSKL
jgi:interleukin-1 receptor-associated kinase 1